MGNAYSDQTRKGEIHGWHVYLIEEDGGAFCKIGTALTLDYRLSGLKNGNPRVLMIVKSWHLSSRASARAAEARALELCSDLRLLGRDWVRGPAIKIGPLIELALAEVGGLRGSNP